MARRDAAAVADERSGPGCVAWAIALVDSEHTPLSGVRFESLLTWSVTGSVGHWGHVHQRRNQYRARPKVEAEHGGWRISALDLLEDERTQ